MMFKSLTKFLVVILLIAAVAYVAFNGVTLFGKTIPSALDKENGIRRGLDLVGGSVITYEAQANKVTEDDMNTVKDVLRQRLDAMGYFEATVTLQGEKRVRIEIPSISNPEEAVQQLGRTAQLQFIDSEGNVVLSGNEVADAQQQYGPLSQNSASEHYVALTLTDEGAKKFSEATGRIKDKPEGQNYIAIKLDEEIVSQPRVQTQINSKECVISGSFDAESATWLANLIRSGKLPFDLKDIELRSVGPTLGDRALETSLYAGAIGIALVMLLMLVYYRLPGLIADIALCGYIAIVMAILGAFRVNLSLPGIAGIILSIGMAVDANVIILERIKEELKAARH